jgi:hypothetical protein
MLDTLLQISGNFPLILTPELPKFEFRLSFLPCSVQIITIHDHAWMAEEIKPVNLRSDLSGQFKKNSRQLVN